MGYTHYWNVATKTKPVIRKQMALIADKVIELSRVKICSGDGNGLHEVTDREIFINGCQENGEDFETFGITFNSGESDFCKTGRRPYDEVVVALLIIAKKLGIITDWGSDGNSEDHQDGINLCKKALTEMGLLL